MEVILNFRGQKAKHKKRKDILASGKIITRRNFLEASKYFTITKVAYKTCSY